MARGYPDFEGGKRGLYLIGEWAAKEGIDKNLWAAAAGKTFGQNVQLTYTVTTGKVLQVVGITYASYANAAADGDNNQICVAQLWIGASNKIQTGGNGGGQVPLRKPLEVAGGLVLNAFCINYANHTTDMFIGITGYEVDE